MMLLPDLFPSLSSGNKYDDMHGEVAMQSSTLLSVRTVAFVCPLVELTNSTAI